MTTDLDTIVNLYDTRRTSMGKFFEQARNVQEIYNGEFAVALPELEAKEDPAIPNLLMQGVDQTGMRIASTPQDVRFEPLKPTKKAKDQARAKKQASVGWLEQSEMDLKMHRRARWLITYATSPVIIRYDRKLGIPRWHLRKPLNTFAAPTHDPDDMTPEDSIFDFTQSWGWLEDHYDVSRLKRPKHVTRDSTFTCIEYVDGDEIVMAVLGEAETRKSGWYEANYGRNQIYLPSGGFAGTESAVELARTPNYAGVCTVVVPGRITLDEPQGQFDGMVGLYQMQAKLMALEVNAVARDVYPDTWVVYPENGNGSIVQVANGLTGVIGEIRGGTIQNINSNPGYQTYPTLNYIERSQRQNGLIPSDFGGEAQTNVRTGRRGDQLLSAVIDFPIQEAQKILAHSAKHEIVRAIAVAKGYAGNSPRSFFVSWKGARGNVSYKANDLFDDDGATLTVKYSYPGTDINGHTIRSGQKLGLELISQQTAREQDPEIEDAEFEHDRIIFERLERSVLVELEQPGTLDVVNKAKLAKRVLDNKVELFDAVIDIHEEAQERQAVIDAEGNPTGVDPMAPEAQPGIVPPGMGAEAGVIPPPPQDMADVSQLFSQIRRPAMTIPAERGA